MSRKLKMLSTLFISTWGGGPLFLCRELNVGLQLSLGNGKTHPSHEHIVILCKNVLEATAVHDPGHTATATVNIIVVSSPQSPPRQAAHICLPTILALTSYTTQP